VHSHNPKDINEREHNVMSNSIIRAGEIIAANTVKNGAFNGEICNLSIIDENGYPTTSVLTPAASEGIRWVAVCTMLDSDAVRRLKNNNRASVSFTSGEYCVNLVGEMEIITDAKMKQEMWYDGLSHHFPAGASDPNYCVLKFTTKRYKLLVDWEENAGTI